MDKKIFLLLSVAAVALSMSGCCQRLMVKSVDQKLLERGITNERIAELEMHNAALRAANQHLLELDNGRK